MNIHLIVVEIRETYSCEIKYGIFIPVNIYVYTYNSFRRSLFELHYYIIYIKPILQKFTQYRL